MSNKTGVWQIGTLLSMIKIVLKSQENVQIVFGKVSTNFSKIAFTGNRTLSGLAWTLAGWCNSYVKISLISFIHPFYDEIRMQFYKFSQFFYLIAKIFPFSRFLWYTLVYFGIFWYTLVYFGIWKIAENVVEYAKVYHSMPWDTPLADSFSSSEHTRPLSAHIPRWQGIP